MFVVPTVFGAESASGIGALGFDVKALIIQLITFLAAYAVLKTYAFGPILKVLNERRAAIDEGVSLGEQMKREKAELDQRVEAELQKARQKADDIIADAQDDSRQTIRDAEAKAIDKATGILQAAEARIDQETAQARKALEKEMVGLISDATEAIIDEKLDAKKDAGLIERALKGRTA